jgi:hypothetical protein
VALPTRGSQLEGVVLDLLVDGLVSIIVDVLVGVLLAAHGMCSILGNPPVGTHGLMCILSWFAFSTHSYLSVPPKEGYDGCNKSLYLALLQTTLVCFVPYLLVSRDLKSISW